MGKPMPTAEEENSSIIHFSHPHPLHLLSNSQTPSHCSACKLPTSSSISADVYACINCNFALHPKCSNLPQQISHPFDEKHALQLYPKPVYPEGIFNCDACGNRGAGFSYHCTPCGIDLHTTCASLPMSLTHHCHTHPLPLTFSAPYSGNTFSCDLCKKLGSKTWLYRCTTCEFDVHLTCVASIIPPPMSPTQQPKTDISTRSVVVPQYGPRPAFGGGGQVVQPNTYPAAGVPLQNQPQAYVHVNQQQLYRPANVLRDQMAVAAVGGIAQSAGQVLFQGLFGGGGGGGGGFDVVGLGILDGGGGATTIDESSYYCGTDGGGFSGGEGDGSSF